MFGKWEDFIIYFFRNFFVLMLEFLVDIGCDVDFVMNYFVCIFILLLCIKCIILYSVLYIYVIEIIV